MPQRLKPGFQPGDPDRGGAHVNAPSRLAQIERGSKNANLARGKALDATV
jgi:hypothetical protein